MNQSLIKTTNNGIMKFTKMTAVAGNVLAAMMEIEHSKIMRIIKRVIKSEHNRKKQLPQVATVISIQEQENLNFNAVFKEWEFTNKMGRTYKTYVMNEDAIYLVIANSQSAKAHELKVWFKSEFNNMRQERNSREHSKQVSRPMTNQIKRLQEKLYDEGSGAASHIYATISKQIHRAATGRPMPKGGVEYGLLSSDENYKVAEFREDVDALIEDALDDEVKARDVKNAIRKMLREVA